MAKHLEEMKGMTQIAPPITVRSAVKGASSLVGKCFFAEAAKPIEFDIIENMKTYPLFGEKVKVDALSSRHD